MNKTIIFSTAGLFVVNLIIGLLTTSYHPFNLIATSVIILATGGLNYITAALPLKDAYKVAHFFLFSFFGVIMFLLLLFSKHQIQDNWCVVVSLVILMLEAIALYITYKVNNHTNSL